VNLFLHEHALRARGRDLEKLALVFGVTREPRWCWVPRWLWLWFLWESDDTLRARVSETVRCRCRRAFGGKREVV